MDGWKARFSLKIKHSKKKYDFFVLIKKMSDAQMFVVEVLDVEGRGLGCGGRWTLDRGKRREYSVKKGGFVKGLYFYFFL